MYDYLNTAVVLTTPYVVATFEFLRQHQKEVALSLLAVLSLGMIFYTTHLCGWLPSFRRKKGSSYQRGNGMTGQAQEAAERVLISDAITDVLEDLAYKGKISNERKLVWQHRFGNILSLQDLISGKHLTIVQELRMRKKAREGGEAVKPVPIPGLAPTDKPAKNAFDAIVRGVK